MIHRTRLPLEGATLLAVLLLPLSQEAPQADPPQQAAPERPAAEAQNSTAINPGEDSQPAETSVEPVQPEEIPDFTPLEPAELSRMRREVVSRLRAGELVHRERLATIHRLKQLAESQGQYERLALLDKLEVNEGAVYANAAQGAATRLGVGYKQSLLRLAAGRIRRNEPKEQPVAPTLTPEQRAERARAKAAENAANKQAAEKKQAQQPRGGASSSSGQRQSRGGS